VCARKNLVDHDSGDRRGGETSRTTKLNAIHETLRRRRAAASPASPSMHTLAGAGTTLVVTTSEPELSL
jgi:hypothetical protein